MTPHFPDFGQRIRAALRSLFGRGENAVTCSFCGRSRLSGETIVAGPGVAICGSCAYLALEFIAAEGDGPMPEGLSDLGVMPFSDPACLLPAGRATLAEDIAGAAASASCRVVGWSYTCSTRDGDYLSVRLARTPELSSEQASNRFIGAFLGHR